MKYLDEYRDAAIVDNYLKKIHELTTKPWAIMEICGGQTHSLVRNGIIDLLPQMITMVHGPGCPVCVTAVQVIDQAIEIAHQKDNILCSFGDMLRVPGSDGSLLKAKSQGASVQYVYSPLDAVNLAKQNRNKNVIFLAVGFETTAPANALSVLQAQELGLDNYFLLMAHVLVPPAIQTLLQDPETNIDGFLAAGHVCAVTGSSEYFPIVEDFGIPIVITGFEPVDLVIGIYKCIEQLERGEARLENQYQRAVLSNGNLEALKMMGKVFEVSDREWRGMGVLPQSGLALRPEYSEYDASSKFSLSQPSKESNGQCIASSILKGVNKPHDCPAFGKTCTPENPLGAPMVSSEGACAAYFNYESVK